MVQGKTRQLRQIVESLLFLARADPETLGPLLEPIDLAAWLAEHLRSWRESRNGPEPRPDVALEPGGTEGPLPVRVQPALLAELVNNLLDNAARYSDPGSPIRVGLRRAGPAVELSVEDRGIGIADEEIPHLFEPFYRSPEARRRGASGLGLGLSVAARLAAAFGGAIEVSSRHGQGSRFTLRLPLDRIEADDPSPVPRSHETAAPASVAP